MDTLILDFEPPELGENTFLLFKPPSVVSLMAVPASSYRERSELPEGSVSCHRVMPQLLEIPCGCPVPPVGCPEGAAVPLCPGFTPS